MSAAESALSKVLFAHRGWRWGLVVLLVMGVGLTYFGTSSCGCGRPREPANRVKCASNLKQIGLAISMYATEHGGPYPDRFETVLLTEDIGSEVFTCPSSNDEKAQGTTAEAAASLSAGGHLSYVYLGKGWDAKTVNPSAILAYEPPSNHDGQGGNILFGDGHVQWVDKSDPIWATLAKH